MTELNKQYFIEKFEAIPEENWHVGDYTNVNGVRAPEATKFCALGHCGMGYIDSNDYLNWTNEGSALSKLFHQLGLDVPEVNDGEDERYQQETPKQRILAALRDLPD